MFCEGLVIVLLLHPLIVLGQFGPERSCSEPDNSTCLDHCQALINNERRRSNHSNYCTAATVIEDCCDVFLLSATGRKTGRYWQADDVEPRSKAFCDMHSSGGGWQVFARYEATESNNNRFKYSDYTQYFVHSPYKTGFGDIEKGYYWYGLDRLHRLTSSFGAQLRIEVEGTQEGFKWAEYDNFTVGPYEENYKLRVSGYNNDSTLMNAMELHDGALFSLFYRKRHTHFLPQCSSKSWPYLGGGGAWWYTNCCNICPFHRQPIFTLDHLSHEYYDRIEMKLRVRRPTCLNRL